MGYRTVIQLVLIIVSIVIITTYIRPTFENMQEVQAETDEYRSALENAAKFNEELARLANTANSFSVAERRALDRFLPQEVDTVGVMRDLETIVGNNRMVLSSLGFLGEGQAAVAEVTGGQVTVPAEVAPNLTTYRFSLQVAGTYEQFKRLLQDLERNVYVLELSSVSFSAADGNLYTFGMEVETYSLLNEVEE